MAVKHNQQKLAEKAQHRNNVLSIFKFPALRSNKKAKPKPAAQAKTSQKTKSKKSILNFLKFPFARKAKSDFDAAAEIENPFVNDEPTPKRAYEDMTSHEISEQVGQIKVLLEQSKYVKIYSDALAPQGTPDQIEKILYADDDFKNYACHHNRDIAHYYASDVAGLGVIQVLLDRQKLPGHEKITDIGFNSNNFMTVETTNHKFIYGNKKGEPEVNRRIMDNIINLMTQQNGSEGHAFTKTFPLYNGANKANYLRISATHESVSPYGATLSIRVTSPTLALTEANFNDIAPVNKNLNVLYVLQQMVKCHVNTIVEGETGTGKTELQKFLIKYISFVDRIVSVEDTDEMHLPELYPDKDIFAWLSGQVEGCNTVTDLVSHSLRNEPKWLIVAETRNAEAFEMEQGVKSGHSIITTMHATSNEAVPSRFAGMIQTRYTNLTTKYLEDDFLANMGIGIHLSRRRFNGYFLRYIDDISEFVPFSKEHPNGVNVLFKQHINAAGIRTYYTGMPTKKLQQKLIDERDRPLSKHEWPIYSKDKPMHEVANRMLYNRYLKAKAAAKSKRRSA